MRGRKPHLVSLSESDRGALQRIVRRGKTEQRVARRARVLLTMEKSQTRVERLAEHLEMGRTTIWELCRRYEERGIEVIYDSPRLGRPRVFSPLGERVLSESINLENKVNEEEVENLHPPMYHESSQKV